MTKYNNTLKTQESFSSNKNYNFLLKKYRKMIFVKKFSFGTPLFILSNLTKVNLRI